MKEEKSKGSTIVGVILFVVAAWYITDPILTWPWEEEELRQRKVQQDLAELEQILGHDPLDEDAYDAGETPTRGD
jgi:hypothetical protein